MASDTGVREAEAFLAENPDIAHVDAFLIDLCGNAFGKRYPAADLPALYAEGSTQCAAMQLTDVTGASWDTLGRGFSDGDPDAPCRPVEHTLARVPWAPEPRAQCLMRFRDGDGPLWFEPRTVLEGVVARFAELGLRPVAAVELEFYLIDRERTPEGAPQPPRSPLTGRRDRAGHVLGMTALEEFGPVIDAIERAARTQNLP